MLLNFLDYFALVINVLYVVYLARLKAWSWSLGIIGALVLLVLFVSIESYSLAILQLVYVVFFSYGWHKWHNQGAEGNHQIIKRMQLYDYLKYGFYLIALCLLCLWFNYFTNSKDILNTGILTGTTLTAIIMTIETFIENWIVWIISDLYFVVIMYQQNLYGQAIQNFIYFFTAMYGFYYWYTSMRATIKN